MADRGTAAANSQDQPIWVQDLIAWLEKVAGQNLTGEQWAERVLEVLAELPGQGLPDEFWEDQGSIWSEEARQEDVREPLNDGDRARIHQELDAAQKNRNELERNLFRDFGYVIRDIADQLPKSETHLLQQVLEFACVIQGDESRSKTIDAIATRLSSCKPQILQKVLGAAQAIWDEQCRSIALAAVAPLLPEPERQACFQQALEAAQMYRALDNIDSTITAVVNQSPTIAPTLFQYLIEVARAIRGYGDHDYWSSQTYRAYAFRAIASRLPITERQYVLSKALEYPCKLEKISQIKAVTSISIQLPITERQSILQKTIEATQQEIADGKSPTEVSVSIAAQLPKTERQCVLSKALMSARKIQDKESQSRAIASIATQLAVAEPKMLRRTLNAAKTSDAFVAVVAQLPRDNPQLLKQALKIVKSFQTEDCKCTAINSLAARLPETEDDLLNEALIIAKDFHPDFSMDCYRSKSITAVAIRLPAEQKSKELQKVLETIEMMGDDDKYTKFFAYCGVVARLPVTELNHLKHALTIAQKFKHSDYRSQAIAEVSDKLYASEPQFLKHVTQIVQSIEDKTSWIKALTNIAFQHTGLFIRYLPKNRLSTALEIIPGNGNSAEKARLLSALAPHLSPGLFPRALELIQTEITHPSYQADSLGNLAPYLPTELLSEALDLIEQHIPGYSYPTSALVYLVPYLSLVQLQQALNIVDPLQNSDNPSENAGKRKLSSYPDLLTQILHQIAIRLSPSNPFQSELDEPIQKETLIQRILDLTQQHLTSEKSITNVLTALAPNLNSNHFSMIIENILSKLNEEFYLAQIFTAFATSPNLTPEQQISFPEPAKSLQIDQKQALRLIREEPNEISKANALVHIASHLLPNQALEAQGVAQDIQNRYHRARSLLALAINFPEIRAIAQSQIDQVKSKSEESYSVINEDNGDSKYVILYIELLSQFATTVPEKIPTLLQAIENWADTNKFKEDSEEPDASTYKRRRILIALKPHLPIRLVREIDRETGIGKAPQDLWERALFVLRNEYRQALKTGSLRNDATQDEDLLNLKDEINALTEMLLMRDLEPPVAVGILGGWGGGKSYIMHLMQTHMVAIRSQSIEEIEAWGLKDSDSKSSDGDRVGRFVGHIYQIKFDAWTYAKANLWASLMQTIFFELDRQLTLETQLNEVFDKSELEDSQKQAIKSRVWPVLYKSSEDERDWFLKEVLKNEKLLDEIQDKQKEQQTGILWQRFKDSQITAIHNLDITENNLKAKKKELEEAKSNLQNQVIKAYSPILNLAENKKFQQVDALFGTSFVLLRRRIGQDALKTLNTEINKQLFGDSSASGIQKSDANAPKPGLWYDLNATLQKLEDARQTLEKLEQKPEAVTATKPQEDTKPVTNQSQKLSKELEAKKEDINLLLRKASEIKFDIFNVAANVIEKKQGFYWKRNCHWMRKNWLLIILFLVLFFIPLGLLAYFGLDLFKVAKDGIQILIVKLTALLLPLLPGVAILQNLIRSSQKWFEETRLALHEYEITVEKRNKELEANYESSLKERLQADPHLQKLEQEVQELERAYAEQKRAAPLNQYASLSAFVSDRLEQGTYKNRLGLMQQVKQDLANLSKKLLPPSQYEKSFQAKLDFLKTVFPRGPARVVLYIDDLDRCPPNTVVEVLEAVQLLVKNPLFIAVLAIDERYINRALAQHYKGVLSLQGSPSAADYLEKIIQIPYRVRPIAEEALRNYLRAQVVVQDSETSGTKFNEFSPQEFQQLVQCCQEAELSPRSLKRLTNVYKLYKVLSRTRGHRPTPKEQQAILSLLVFSSRYPDLMRGILQEIGSHYEEGRHQMEEDSETLASVFNRYLSRHERRNPDIYLAQDIQKLRHDVGKLIAPHDLKLKEMRGIFDFVRTFSFVGDIGVDSTSFTPSIGSLG